MNLTPLIIAILVGLLTYQFQIIHRKHKIEKNKNANIQTPNLIYPVLSFVATFFLLNNLKKSVKIQLPTVSDLSTDNIILR